MSGFEVLIVGASIAGPATAYWFARAGANITVIERFPDLRVNGQAIDIRTAGVTVMRKMKGMEAAVRAKRDVIEGFQIVDGDGKEIVTIKATGNPDQQSLLSEYEILRGDLSRILHDLSREVGPGKVKYVFSEQIAAIHETREGGEEDGPVTVDFANGQLPTSRYDLVVACDGATSRTRAIGLGCGVRDYTHPLNVWAAYFSIKPDLLSGSYVGQACSAVGGRFLAAGPDPESGGNRVVAMGIFPRKDLNAMQAFRAAAKQDDGALKRYIARHYEGAGWKSEEIFQGMLESRDFYASEMLQVKVPSLHRGRFVLVGDAGYAAGPTGTGTSLALAGAYVLAGEVHSHKGDLAAGLRAYEARMRPIIKDMQQIPPGVPGIMAPQTALRLRLRNVVLRLIGWAIAFSAYFSGVVGFVASLWASSSMGKDKYGLPEYEWEG